MEIKRAERKQAVIKMGLQGPSGSGKTYSALLIAKGIVNDWEIIEHHEVFKILLLNNKNVILRIAEISKGGITSTIIDARIVFQYALKAHATGIIVAHNHPSNNPTPSESDVDITKKLIQAGSVLNIQVLDHLILCSDGSYYSLGDEGRM